MIAKGTIRFCTFLAMILLSYVGWGGELQIFWQPFELLMVVAINLVVVYGVGGSLFSKAKSIEEIATIKEAGRLGFWGSISVPALLGVVHGLTYLDSGLEVHAELLSATLIGMVYSVSIYICYFTGLDQYNSKKVSAG